MSNKFYDTPSPEKKGFRFVSPPRTSVVAPLAYKCSPPGRSWPLSCGHIENLVHTTLLVFITSKTRIVVQMPITIIVR